MSDEICAATECNRVAVARGFCLKHYKRFMNHGDANAVLRDLAAHANCLICGTANPPGRSKYCSSECGRVGQRRQIDKWRTDNPERQRRIDQRASEKRRRTRHNLPPDTPWLTHCEICNEEAETHLDHDHGCCPGKYSCGRCIRGWLCNNCNNGLGRFKDDPALLRSAAAYLERTRVM